MIDEPIPEPEEKPKVSTGYHPCTNGKAGDYPCDGYDLQSIVSLTEMKAKSANDIWGWTDPVSKKEYAIIGLDNGTAFVDISNPRKPVYLGKLPTATTNSKWRDVKVHKNHAFIVSEAAHHGLQIFDLTRLRKRNTTTSNFYGRYTLYKRFWRIGNQLEADGAMAMPIIFSSTRRAIPLIFLVQVLSAK